MISHLNTLVWLQFVFFRRGFTELLKIRFGRVISITICIALAGLILALFALGLFAGNIVGDLANDQILQGRNPNGFYLMVAVDVALIPFLSFWLIGLLAECMRDEPLDFRRVLFLPIPLSTVFILNFSIAIISPLALVFTVPLISFSISAAISLGPHMLLAIPLGFIFYIALAVGLALSLLIALLSIPPAFGMLIDAILDRFWGYQGISVGMLSTLAMVIIVTPLYRFTLPKLGSLLHQREKIILNRLMKEKR